MNHHRPMIVIGENVPNLAKMNGGSVLDTILTDFRNVGYRFEVWTMHAKDYGVPQGRVRLIFMGVRDDLVGFPIQPNPTDEVHSIEWAIGDLINVFDESVPNQSEYFKANKAKKGNGQGAEANRADEPAYTIRANAKSRVHFHYQLDRRLTVRECARIQTFPDEFIFKHSKTTNIMQIGNAVPPILAHLVGESVAKYLLNIVDDEERGKMRAVDITPTPRVLRVLGEIPFQPWQCFAELIDNSIDAFIEADRAGYAVDEKRLIVRWSTEAVGESNRTIEIIDNARGMNIEQLTNAVKAGYSSNDPTSNLWLFGMGFNISTARLGEKTTILSTRAGDSEWIGIEIDFNNLIKGGGFSAPLITRTKDSPDEHGTIIEVSDLKDGVYSNIKQTETQIRRQLENIYAPLLNKNDVGIFVQGKKLSPKQHYVTRKI